MFPERRFKFLYCDTLNFDFHTFPAQTKPRALNSSRSSDCRRRKLGVRLQGARTHWRRIRRQQQHHHQRTFEASWKSSRDHARLHVRDPSCSAPAGLLRLWRHRQSLLDADHWLRVDRSVRYDARDDGCGGQQEEFQQERRRLELWRRCLEGERWAVGHQTRHAARRRAAAKR